MTNEFSQQKDKIQKLIETKTEVDIKNLKEYTRYIKNKYSELHLTQNLSLVYRDIYNYIKDSNFNLTEKCIRRSYDIENSERLFKDKEVITKISDLKMLWLTIRMDLLPLEVLYYLECKIEDDTILTEQEQEIFDYLKAFADFYLNETNEFVNMYKKHNNKIFQKKKQ